MGTEPLKIFLDGAYPGYYGKDTIVLALDHSKNIREGNFYVIDEVVKDGSPKGHVVRLRDDPELYTPDILFFGRSCWQMMAPFHQKKEYFEGCSQAYSNHTASELEHRPERVRNLNRLLGEYLQQHSDPADIVFLLDSALHFEFLFGDYLETNPIYFRPVNTRKNRPKRQFIHGDLNPKRDLLIFDTDAQSGKSIAETRDFFAKKGYSVDRMDALLFYGYTNDIDLNVPMEGRYMPVMFPISELKET